MQQVQNQLFLGNEAFVRRVTTKAGKSAASREVPKQQRQWRSLKAIERDAGERNDAIREAYASGHYTLAEIGRHFGLHYATVSRLARG
jgi:hypothetical protein